MIFILSGPGGVGKGTVVRKLIERDPLLWLSRSWTTRSQRPGEADDAYVFATPEQFRDRINNDGFWEWVEFLGSSYGTPVPYDAPPEMDVLLEIELQGAQLIKERHPEAKIILLVPPSEEAQRQRLAGRGEDPERIEARVVKGEFEMRMGRKIADVEVVNDDLETAIRAVGDIINRYRAQERTQTQSELDL